MPWDLYYLGDTDDQAFCDEVLGARMASDDSETSAASGVGLLEGIDLDFGETGAYGGGAPYPVEYPDVLASDREVIATYAGGDVAAVMGEGVAVFGFPVECIGDEGARAEVARRRRASPGHAGPAAEGLRVCLGAVTWCAGAAPAVGARPAPALAGHLALDGGGSRSYRPEPP